MLFCGALGSLMRHIYGAADAIEPLMQTFVFFMAFLDDF
jgi:hypothetical protein